MEEPRRQPRVLVVDDHPLWRQTVRSLLETTSAAGEVLEAGDALSAIETAAEQCPDVVVMDMALPGRSGVEATRAIVEQNAEIRVLVLSSSDDDEQVIDAVRAGATGYLLKTAEPEEIVDAIRRVLVGELVFPGALASVVRDGMRTGGLRTASALDRLSSREVDVLRLMAEGHTNQGIGRVLSVSEKTVERHVTTIFTKLGLDAETGGHRRVLAVILYLRASSSRDNPRRGAG